MVLIKTKSKTNTVTKVAVAIAVASVLGIMAAGLGFKFGPNNTEAKLSLKSPADDAKIIASQNLEVEWETNVPEGKGVVDVYLTKTDKTPYDANYNDVNGNIIWSSKGISPEKNGITTQKTIGEILTNKSLPTYAGTILEGAPYKVWVLLRKAGAPSGSAAFVEKTADIKVVYGKVKSFEVGVKDGGEKYWGEDVSVAYKYNFPETGEVRIHIERLSVPVGSGSRYPETVIEPTVVGAGSLDKVMRITNASQFPAGEYQFTATWKADSCSGVTACDKQAYSEGPKFTVSAPLTVKSTGTWSGGVINCARSVANNEVSLAKFSLVNENNQEYPLKTLNVKVIATKQAISGRKDEPDKYTLSLAGVYLADENGNKIVDADSTSFVLNDDGARSSTGAVVNDAVKNLSFDLSNKTIGLKATKNWQIKAKVPRYTESKPVNVQIVSLLGGPAGGKPADLEPNPLVIVPSVLNTNIITDCRGMWN